MNQFELHTEGQEEMRLEAALLLYSSKRFNAATYATAHEIHEVNGRPEIGAGVAIEKSDVLVLLQGLGESISFAGFLPVHLLYTRPGAVVWWSPPRRRHVWFKCSKAPADDQAAEDTGAASLASRSGDAPHPGLVFAAAGSEWFVRALAGAERPTPKTPLFIAPYFNVWDESRICTGNVTLPTRYTADVTAKYEEAFFRSKFTHPNSKLLTTYEGGPYALWADLLDGKHPEFPADCMVPAKQTLEAWVNKITKGDA